MRAALSRRRKYDPHILDGGTKSETRHNGDQVIAIATSGRHELWRR